jgi:cytochrome b561
MATPIPRSYDRAQRTLHWLMAALILAAIPLGLAAASLPAGASPRVAMLTAHKSLGMTVLVLAVLRLAYRAAVGAPPYAELLAPLLRAASQLAHFALYALMIALPAVGYVASAAGGHEVSWFGLFVWPALGLWDKALAHLAAEAHSWLGWTLIAVVALHLAAVAWHLWVRRDEVFARMWPGRAAPAR